MSIGTPKRLKELETARDDYTKDSPLSVAHIRKIEQVRGFKECWEAVKPVLEAAQQIITSLDNDKWDMDFDAFRDALEGLALED